MKVITVAFTVLLCLGSVAFAQTDGVSKDVVDQQHPSEQPMDFSTLTLEQAVAFARVNAPAIKEAELTVALAELDLKSTQFWRQLVPSLTVHQGYDPLIGESRVGLGLSFNITRLFDESDNAKAAKLKWFNAELYRQRVHNQVVVDVTRSYYDFVAAQKQVSLLEEQLSTQLKLSELGKLQFESGQTTLSSVLSTMQSVAATQLALLKAQAEVPLAQLRLKHEIGWDRD